MSRGSKFECLWFVPLGIDLTRTVSVRTIRILDGSKFEHVFFELTISRTHRQCEWARALAYLCVFYWCSDIWIMPEQSKWDIGASSTYPRIHRNKKIKNTLKLKQSNTQLCRAIRYKDTRILFDFSGRWMGCKVLASMLALMDSHKFGVKFAQILRYLAIPQILIAIRDKLRECVCFCDTQKPSKSVA